MQCKPHGSHGAAFQNVGLLYPLMILMHSQEEVSFSCWEILGRNSWNGQNTERSCRQRQICMRIFSASVLGQAYVQKRGANLVIDGARWHFSSSGEFIPEVIESNVQWHYLSPLFLHVPSIFFFFSFQLTTQPHAKAGFTRHWLDLMTNGSKGIGHLLGNGNQPGEQESLPRCCPNKYDTPSFFNVFKVYEL